jgi:hypothetical protein
MSRWEYCGIATDALPHCSLWFFVSFSFVLARVSECVYVFMSPCVHIPKGQNAFFL